MYKHARGVGKDDKKAVEWYRKAAEQGDFYAKQELAEFLHSKPGK